MPNSKQRVDGAVNVAADDYLTHVGAPVELWAGMTITTLNPRSTPGRLRLRLTRRRTNSGAVSTWAVAPDGEGRRRRQTQRPAARRRHTCRASRGPALVGSS